MGQRQPKTHKTIRAGKRSINVLVSAELYALIDSIAAKSDLPLSRVAGALIEAGVRLRDNGEQKIAIEI